MNKVLAILPLILAVVTAQAVPAAFSSNQLPATLVPGVAANTGFDTNNVGSQYNLWVPWNVSSIRFDISRDASNDACSNQNVYVYLYAKLGSYPCTSSAYYGLDEFCVDNSEYLAYATSSADFSILNAYDSDDLRLNSAGISGDDFLRGDYIYLATYSDVSTTNCTATLNATLDYCAAGTIAAEGSSDTQCVSYTNVTGTSYTTSQTANGPFAHFYMLNVPQNNSGIYVTLLNNNDEYIYIFGRLSSGGIEYNYYDYTGSYVNQTLWFSNVPAGQFILTIEQESTTTGQVYDLSVNIQSCPAGWGPDEDGYCGYPVNTTTLSGLATLGSVTVAATNYSGFCNWKFFVAYVPPLTYGYLNLTITETGTSSGYVYLRKNAFPSESDYDDYVSTSVDWSFTPEDTYINKPTWYYFGVCNDDNTAASSWTFAGSFGAAGPSASATPSPAVGASPSPDSGSDSGASAIFFSVFVTLAALVLAF